MTTDPMSDPTREALEAILDIVEETSESLPALDRRAVENIARNALSITPAPLDDPDDDDPAFMIMHNAGRHDISCSWSRPGIIDPRTHPCACGLGDDIEAVRQYALSITPAPDLCPECAHPLTEHRTPGGECVHAFCIHDQSFELVRESQP